MRSTFKNVTKNNAHAVLKGCAEDLAVTNISMGKDFDNPFLTVLFEDGQLASSVIIGDTAGVREKMVQICATTFALAVEQKILAVAFVFEGWESRQSSDENEEYVPPSLSENRVDIVGVQTIAIDTDEDTFVTWVKDETKDAANKLTNRECRTFDNSSGTFSGFKPLYLEMLNRKNNVDDEIKNIAKIHAEALLHYVDAPKHHS